MDLTRTRTALHGVAELLLAGPQYAESGTIRLRALPAGIATVAAPDLRIEGAELVGARGRHPLSGTYAEVAAAAGIRPGRWRTSTTTVRRDPDHRIELDPAHLAMLRRLSPSATRRCGLRAREVPVLWPEHFDVGISLDEVNYGVSPATRPIAEPYAYVGPWTPRTGDFWNQSFGAAQPLSALGGADAVADFFREGARLAAG